MPRTALSSSAARSGPADGKAGLMQNAYAAFKSAIHDSAFAPGEQISAQVLAERLGMSRTPIQEAALRLQQEGLVQILPKRGIRICAITPDDVQEIYDILIGLEGIAAERIAAMAADTRAAAANELADHTSAMVKAMRSGDLKTWGRADAAFHAALIGHCNNSRLATIIATVNDQSHRVRMMTLPLRTDLAQSARDHRAIIEAVREGRAATAYRMARDHRLRARDEILPLLHKLGLKHL